MKTTRLSRAALFSYASLRMPVALLELPLFILLPVLYHRQYGLSLTTIGAVLFAARGLDALLDPVIGRLIDRHRQRVAFVTWVRFALPALALAFMALLMPPVRGPALAVWLAVMSVLAYVAYSTVTIAHQAWGAGLGERDADLARVTSTREAFGLLGVLLALGALSPERTGWLSAAIIVLVAVSLLWSRSAPAAPQVTAEQPRASWRPVFRNLHFRWLLAAFLFSGVATAIPATLVLFFASDVLEATSDQAALFLGLYFVAAAIGMPSWLAISRRLGLRRTWVLGMAVAVLGFIWTLSLGKGDHLAFGVVCAATGWALGSDLAMPPALLARCIAAHGDRGRLEGSYFGLWSLVTKLNLALAAGLALPLVEWSSGYFAVAAQTSLTYVYAALPSLLKLVAACLALAAPWPDDSCEPSDVPMQPRQAAPPASPASPASAASAAPPASNANPERTQCN